jgi:CubicO group peptidase (beta-lactamase class C family)
VVQERIFTPLGMKHSGYDVAATLIHRRHQRLQHAVAAGPRESIGEVVSSAFKASKPGGGGSRGPGHARRATSLVLHQGGREMPAKRTE